MVGGSSLLVIFAVLCLTVFALLGLSTVQADGRLSDTSAQAVADYYEADTQAETILAQLRGGQIPEGVTVTGNHYAYACPISQTQCLEVELEGDPDGGFTILRWQAVSTTDWTPEDGIEVWNGE
jgi:hypothetical protein